MNQIIKMETINFAELVKTNTLSLSLEAQSDMINLLNTEFTQEESKRYIINLYMYLNFHPINDFPINLDHVYKDLGFANKGNAMKTIKSNFTKDEDYKNLLVPMEKQVKTNGGAGLNKEDIMLNVDTYKTLCMLVKTPQGKEIRKYYVKLENIYNSIIKKEIENKDKLLEQKEQLLLEQSDQINQLENKPETNGFIRKSGYVYMIGDTTKEGHMKLGFGDPENRVSQLNIGSSTHSLEVKARFETIDVEFLEKIIHYSLNPFRIRGRKEWFYFKNDFELAYSINIIKKCIGFVKRFDIINYESLKELNKELDIKKELEEFNKELDKEILVKEVKHKKVKEVKTKEIKQDKKEILIKKEVYKKDTIYIKSDKYIGVFFLEEKNKWISKLQEIYLGIFDTELEAAKTYNDYVMYINDSNIDFNYILNDIPDYISTPRNIIDENYIHENKICKYNGISYSITRKKYTISIKLNGKTYHLGSNNDEIESAKIYNQQALYFNETLNTKYIINDIPNYNNVAKNIYKELQEKKKTNKTSNYIGVSYDKQKNKWRSCYVINKKQKNIGFFNTELEAAKEYNKIVMELNKNGCTYEINHNV